MIRQNAKIGKKYRRDEMQIVDQSIRVGQLQWGLQTIQSWSNAIQAAESVHNPRRKPLYDFYNNIEKDPHLDSIMDKRTRAVRTAEIVWENIDNDKLKEQLHSPWFFELLSQMMQTVFKGHTLIGFKPNKVTGVVDTYIVPRQNVNPELGLITKEIYGNTGISYKEGRYPKYIMEMGKPEHIGKLSRIGPYVLMKKDNLVFYAYHNQFFGMPMRVYTYEAGNLQQRREMENTAEAMAASPYVIIPKGGSVDIKDSNKSGASQAYKEFHSICNDEMSISILGQTLTTSNGNVGSNALGRVHQAVEEAVNLEDMLRIEYAINYHVLPILRAHGYTIPENGKGKFKRTERLSKVQQVQIMNTVAQNTLITPEVWYKEFGIDPPTAAELKEWKDKPIPIKAGPEKPKEEEEEQNKEDEKKKNSLTAQIDSLYIGLPTGTISAAFNDELSTVWDRITQLLFDGSLKAGDVDQELIELIAGRIFEEVEAGFGAQLSTLEVGQPDEVLLSALKDNVQLFSQFKTEKTLRAAAELLVTSEGVKRPFNEFKELALQINETYNVNYLYTEYQLANGNAQMNRKWQEIIRDQEALPLLQVDVTMDDRTRHAKFNKITLPIDHPFWKNGGYPLYDYGCRCSVRQLSDGTINDNDSLPDLTIALKEEFQFNAGIEKVVFPPKHPYYNESA